MPALLQVIIAFCFVGGGGCIALGPVRVGGALIALGGLFMLLPLLT